MSLHAQGEVSKRSCNSCRQRKVRCDRKCPCDTCVRLGKECTFPGPKRASRKLNRPPVSELMARLKQLEDAEKLRAMHLTDKDDPAGDLEQRNNAQTPGSTRPDLQKPDPSGRLVVKDGRTRYVEDNVSVIFGDKIRELQDIVESPSSEDDVSTEDILGPFGLPHGGLVGDSDWTKASSKVFYPHPAQLDMLWRIYKNRVHPLIAVLHEPSVERIIRDTVDGVVILEPCNRSLILSVCFAAVVSMIPDECVSTLGQTHEMAMEGLSVAVNRALKQANFIKSQDLPVLQAAVLFLLCLRVVGDTRIVWAEAAVVVRVAQGQGIHRDGSKFGLSPFQTEMRRRLWWHICILDMLASEDQGTDTQIKPDTFDIRLPSNVDGCDLAPDMIELPPEKMGYTDITLCILNCEIATSVSQLGPSSRSLDISISDREAYIKNLASRLQDRYLDHFDLGSPIQWMVATISRLMLSKVWLAIHIQKTPQSAHKSALARQVADPIFQTAVEITEFAYLFQENETIANFAWLCRSYKQWHALAYALSELCVRDISPETDYAWNVVSKMYKMCVKEAPKTYAMFQKPLSRLMERAASSRVEKLGISRELLDSQTAEASGFDTAGINHERKLGLFPPMPDVSLSYYNPTGGGPTELVYSDNISLAQDMSASGITDYLSSNIDWLFEPLL
ncbi:C6 transcription factor [Aspergillus bertholletiae]|uniref:C6 transcription factor n=1 Tax=Aspergillus bertholletiae TaxID=1226010 RepID=A0A5N7AZQ9_9EURO|nr:C6 transcription factor [Aspergillus bertholletiae]